MGYNTGVLILNDAIPDITDNPEKFVQNLYQAIRGFGKNPLDFAIGNHVNGGKVFHCNHADWVGVYAIGGNHTSKLLEQFNGGHHHDLDDQLSLLDLIADNLGYRLVKKKRE